jgi:16S rRNA (guanine527-N7)-methyltransferase
MRDAEPSSDSETAVAAYLERGLAELAPETPADQVERLARLVQLVSEWAGRINLTSHRDPIALAGHLVLDAAALAASLPELAAAERLADLGSGIGFPGLPIAVLHPSLEVVLVESRSRRHHLQREIRRRLGLTRVIPILGRSDEVEVRPADVVVAQAMTRPEQALREMGRWSRPGGLVVLPASEGAERPQWPPGLDAPVLREYRVPQIGRLRRLWVARTKARAEPDPGRGESP